MSEIEYWTKIQDFRKCHNCLYFDSKKVGQMGFCTYGGKLIIDETTRVCKKRKHRIQPTGKGIIYGAC